MAAPTEILLPKAQIVSPGVRRSAVERARSRSIILPTFAQLSGYEQIPDKILAELNDADPDAPESVNLWRVNWFNAADRRKRAAVPSYVVLPQALTGVRAPIVVLLGARFPMIGAHKVLPAYACLVTRLVSGRFDPDFHRAVWPSTGNYCRGGVAISRIMGCAGLAVLPERMSRERYDWLERWVADPSHILKTSGGESNVKEIYDKCKELALHDRNITLNQFSDFSNYMAHYTCTGDACERVFSDLKLHISSARLAAFVCATGSAGTIAAGDKLKIAHGTRIAAVEALECPTLMENGYGEHNIQGIGDKHVPLIHNVMNLDFVVGISDKSTNLLNCVFNDDASRARVARGLALHADELSFLDEIGISGIANILACIKLAKHMEYGPSDIVVTVATDRADLYQSERQAAALCQADIDVDRVLAQHIGLPEPGHVLETNARERRRIFNLGYYTWVEQQGVSLDDFDARRDQSFWHAAAGMAPAWDKLIAEFNADVGLN